MVPAVDARVQERPAVAPSEATRRTRSVYDVPVKAPIAVVVCCLFGCASSESTHGVPDLTAPTGGGDMAMSPPDLTTCMPNTMQCTGDALVVCGADGGTPQTTQCPFGCSTSGAGPHCQTLVPTTPVIGGDLTIPGLTPVMLSATSYVFDTATGAIHDGAGTVVRDANLSVSPGAMAEVHQGIAFHTIEANFVIWTFGDLTVGSGAQVVFKGGARVALASEQGMSIGGVIDVRGYDFSGATPVLCAGGVGGPGGGAGGAATMRGGPAGAGGAGSVSGGGGGGDGDVGGNGGGATMGGAVRGTQTLSGGVVFAGAGGGGPTGVGGGAGGGLQLVALGPVVIDVSAGARGGIDLGGCGGRAGGGGGGAAGELLIEAASVEVRARGAIAANGGGGGGTAADGQPGDLTAAAAMPGAGGGAGGVTGSLAGAASATAGGGGGSGRIRFSTRSGSVTIDSAAVVSPGLADKDSMQQATVTAGVALVQ